MAPAPRLKAVGYWRSFDNYRWTRSLPSPRWLVDRRWRVADREKIVAYLRSGAEVWGWLGFSYCRFHCGVKPHLMGSRDFSDGVWLWPEGLAHYIEAHDVALPDAFLHTMESHGWQVPTEFVARVRKRREAAFVQRVATGEPGCVAGEPLVEREPWLAWAKARKPWYVFW